MINQPIDEVYATFDAPDRRPPRLLSLPSGQQAPSDDSWTHAALRRIGRFAGQRVELRYVFYPVPGGTQVTVAVHVVDRDAGMRGAAASAAARRFLAAHLRGMKDSLE